MSPSTIEERLTAVEIKLEQLQQKKQDGKAAEPRGWQKIVGIFADDSEFEEAMRLGREYRESLRPKDDEAISC